MKQSYPRVRVKSQKSPMAARPKFRASYEAAGDGRRSDSWSRATGTGPETAGRMSFKKLRDRSRFEARNHAVASRIVDVIVSETIGEGLRPHIVGDEALGKLWAEFVDECDADGVRDFFGMQDTAMRDIVIAGEVFTRFRPRRISDGLPVPMQLQLLPSEMVPLETPTNQAARSGIVFAGPGQRSAYLFHKEHPGETGSLNGSTALSSVPADGVAHSYLPREIGQLRGEPWLARAIIKIHDLDASSDALLLRQKLAAMIAFFVEMPQEEAGEVYEEEDEDGNLITVDAAGNPIEDPMDLLPSVEPGATLPLPAGAKMVQSQINDVGSSFDPFVRQVMREVCAAVSVPYELITNDWSGVNDRLARVSLQRFYKQVKGWRKMVIRSFCRPTWIQFLDAAVASGAWKPATGKTVQDYYRIDFIGDPFPHIHPTQDVQADALAVRNGFKTRSQVIRERGGNPDTVRSERAAELKADDEAGVVFDTDPRVKDGMIQENQTEEGQENGTNQDKDETDTET